MKILIVEDDPILAMVCSMALEEAGHEIVGPVYDLEGFGQVTGLATMDLALVDINLAGDNEGLGVARILREQYGVPSLFLSGQLLAARENAHLALGMLRKPYDIEDLVQAVAYVQVVLREGFGATVSKPLGLEMYEPA